jgi:hypothetical protein
MPTMAVLTGTRFPLATIKSKILICVCIIVYSAYRSTYWADVFALDGRRTTVRIHD